MASSKAIPVIDLFAGPGGLGEGFSALKSRRSSKFRIGLSIEKDSEAHQTLQLRSFFRQFRGDVPDAYYSHLKGELTRAELTARYPREAHAADKEAWCVELGNVDVVTLHNRVRDAVGRRDDWVLIGGPPCQAYSLVGRSRMRGADPLKYERDPRHVLYLEYLRILAKHRPPVFVMENVKGLLSSSWNGAPMFERILNDLQAPAQALQQPDRPRLRYRLHSLSPVAQSSFLAARDNPSDFILRSEEFGIPQARHRIIIVGVREDVGRTPRLLVPYGHAVPAGDVILDLPRIRSQISRGADSASAWSQLLVECAQALKQSHRGEALGVYLKNLKFERPGSLQVGTEYAPLESVPMYRSDWYNDSRLGGICNHVSRSHLPSDIQRYFFAAAFAAARQADGRSPLLSNFPEFLLPEHSNVQLARDGKMFGDRFRVQVDSRPASTVTSHISKDGHYYIHPDPMQARSLTVREAARLQTFPDNYLFCGPRTSQYHQVGNAVPPLLAKQIADVVAEIFS